MPYLERHKLLTFGGKVGAGSEDWSVGMRFNDPSPPNATMLAAAAAEARTFITQASGWQFTQNISITWAKLAPIGVDGKYPGNEDAIDQQITLASGPTTTNNYQATQVCCVVTHTTAQLRGRAHVGRTYMPPPGFPLSNTGLFGTGQVSGMLTAYRTMVVNLNAVQGLGHLTVMSKFGISNIVTGFRIGLVPDTMRSRRRSMPENPQALAL